MLNVAAQMFSGGTQNIPKALIWLSAQTCFPFVSNLTKTQEQAYLKKSDLL